MKTYPSISYGETCHLPVVAFDKLDGSNIRVEWSSKKGWYKFGSRHRLFDASDATFRDVPNMLAMGMADPLGRAMVGAGYDRAVCFFEFWGPSSFAGAHLYGETKSLTLIDVAPYKHGILDPETFLKLFGHLDVPKVLYTGPVTDEFIESVRSSTLPDMTFEGVVCKTKNDKKTKAPIMFKQKSKAWLDKLHDRFGDNKELLKSLM